jgi:hypothetical protein
MIEMGQGSSADFSTVTANGRRLFAGSSADTEARTRRRLNDSAASAARVGPSRSAARWAVDFL